MIFKQALTDAQRLFKSFLARNGFVASLFASFLRARQFFRFVRVAGSE
jgi:hypothetical protein